MVFFINAATTVEENLENLRLQFSRLPTLQEFAAAVESHFTTATGLPFIVDTMVLFDEYTSKWRSLYSSLQLSTDCQVYVYHHTRQQHAAALRAPPVSIPPPSRTISCITPLKNTSTVPFSPSCLTSTCCCLRFYPPSHTTWMNTDVNTDHECRCKCGSCDNTNMYNCHVAQSAMHSPQRICDSGAQRRWKVMKFGEKLRTAFYELDIQQKGFLMYTDFKRALDAQQKVFINHSAGALFALADRDGDNCISYKEWVGFAATHSAMMGALLTLVPLLPWFSAKRNPSFLRLPVPELQAVLEYEEARLARDAAVVAAAAVAIGGQRPRRQYLNRVTEFFFRELDKGYSSIYVVLATGALLSVAGWKLMVYYIEPRRATQRAVWRRPHSRVPLSDAHNAFWGFEAAEPHPNHLAPTMTSDVEDALRRPTLVYSAASEVDGSVMCMQLPEYDTRRGDDVVYRSVHYLGDGTQQHGVSQSATVANAASTSTSSLSSSSGVGAAGDRERGGGDTLKGGRQQHQEGAEGEKEEGYARTFSYLSRIPDGGGSVIHGMVKCKAITAQDNCVPYAGHLESEYARKMMLALGPVHILRDIAKTSFPFRFTSVKEPPISALVCGLHSGEIPRWLSNAFPNFHVDVVEGDGTLARVCRRFMGFQESSNLRLFIADPIDFLRHGALVNYSSSNSGSGSSDGAGERRYDLIMLDTVDGMGRLSTQYGRLEFINSVRNNLTAVGCVIASIPNRDGTLLYNMVQNWRMAFAGRTVILVHCVTSPHTLLMTFQDDAARGKASFGTISGVDEFRDLLRTKLSHYGPQRVQFDLTREVSKESFSVLLPGRMYPLAAYLPAGHPQLRDASKARGEGVRKWGAWLQHWTGTWLTPTQRADLHGMRR